MPSVGTVPIFVLTYSASDSKLKNSRIIEFARAKFDFLVEMVEVKVMVRKQTQIPFHLKQIASEVQSWDDSALGQTLKELRDLQPLDGTRITPECAKKMRKAIQDGIKRISILQNDVNQVKEELKGSHSLTQASRHKRSLSLGSSADRNVPYRKSAVNTEHFNIRSPHRHKNLNSYDFFVQYPRKYPNWATRKPLPGERCAARVAVSRDLWILTLVESYNALDETFVVIDDDNENDIRRYTVKSENVLNLARPEESNGNDFPLGSEVLAMYPNTSSFYRSIIIENPRIGSCDVWGNRQDMCNIQFEQDEDEETGLPKTHSIPVCFVCYRPEFRSR